MGARILDSARVRSYSGGHVTKGVWLSRSVPKGDVGCFDEAKRARQIE
jgi:hypothetical protein